MFKYFSSHTAAVGMLGSLAMCFLVDPIYASIAISVLIALVLLLHLRGFETSWGSISQALLFHQVSFEAFWGSISQALLFHQVSFEISAKLCSFTR